MTRPKTGITNLDGENNYTRWRNSYVYECSADMYSEASKGPTTWYSGERGGRGGYMCMGIRYLLATAAQLDFFKNRSLNIIFKKKTCNNVNFRGRQ